MALQFGNTKIGEMQYNGVTIGEAMIDGQIVYRSSVSPAAVATLELGPETVQGYSFPARTVYTIPEGKGGIYLVEAVATQTPELSNSYVSIMGDMWISHPAHPDGGYYARSNLGQLYSGVPLSHVREFMPGDQVLLSASLNGSGSFVLHANVQVFFLGPAQDLPRYMIDHTSGGADPGRSEWVTVYSTVVAHTGITSGTWTVTWDRPASASYYGVRAVLDGHQIAAISPWTIGTARPTHQTLPVSEIVVLEGQTIEFQVYTDSSTATNRKINSTRTLLS